MHTAESDVHAALSAAVAAVESISLAGNRKALFQSLLESARELVLSGETSEPKLAYLELPDAALQRVFLGLADIDRGELVVDFETRGISVSMLAVRLKIGARRLRALREMAREELETKDLLRLHRIQESSMRALHDRPSHISLLEILPLVAKYKPSRKQIYIWMRGLEGKPISFVESALLSAKGVK